MGVIFLVCMFFFFFFLGGGSITLCRSLAGCLRGSTCVGCIVLHWVLYSDGMRRFARFFVWRGVGCETRNRT